MKTLEILANPRVFKNPYPYPPKTRTLDKGRGFWRVG
jgi:hypothetical protein